MYIIALFKNKAFRSESEWRMVTLGSEFDMSQQPVIPAAEIFYRPRLDSLAPT
jgi:hypothetical protein